MLVTDQRPREVLVLTRGRLSGAPFLGDSLLICMGPQIILRLISELLSLSPGGVLMGYPGLKYGLFHSPGGPLGLHLCPSLHVVVLKVISYQDSLFHSLSLCSP